MIGARSTWDRRHCADHTTPPDVQEMNRLLASLTAAERRAERRARFLRWLSWAPAIAGASMLLVALVGWLTGANP